jgi:hypothetical protein
MLRALDEEARAAQWGHMEELLALNVEVTHALYRLTLAVWSDKGTTLPTPLRIPRPSDEPDEEEDVPEPEPVTRETYRRALLGGG